MSAAPGIFGIVGAGLGYVIYNWENLSFQGSPRNFILCQLAFIIIMNFVIYSESRGTTSNCFSLIAGVFLGCVLSNKYAGTGGASVGLSTHERIVRNIGIGLTLGMAAVFIATTLLIK